MRGVDLTRYRQLLAALLFALVGGALVAGVAADEPRRSSAEVGDLVWATHARLPTGREGLGVAVSSSGDIYAIGGYNYFFGGTLSVVEAYDPGTNTWTTRASMPTARDRLGVTGATNGKIYAIGGHSSGDNSLATVGEYDPAADTWTIRASMPTARRSLGVVASHSRIYAIGGVVYDYGSGYRHLDAVDEYDPTANTWRALARLPTVRAGLGLAAASNGKLYAIGRHSRLGGGQAHRHPREAGAAARQDARPGPRSEDYVRLRARHPHADRHRVAAGDCDRDGNPDDHANTNAVPQPDRDDGDPHADLRANTHVYRVADRAPDAHARPDSQRAKRPRQQRHRQLGRRHLGDGGRDQRRRPLRHLRDAGLHR
ncbi:MAG: hypothetical protein HYY04_08530 [Chloroflexi bacterium]|nr:hypothetical protein [Chloroflexota bacterium]